MFRNAAPLIFVITALAGCSEFPQLDDAVDSDAQAAQYPDLVPIEDIYATIPGTRINDETTMDVETRIARLKSRAARLRGAVIGDQSRKRLQGGVS